MRLGIVVIVLLLAAWAVILLPSVSLGRRLGASTADGIRKHERFMGLLASTRAQQVPGRWVVVPGDMAAPNRRRARVIRRRRQTFVRMLGVVATTLILGLIPGLRAFLILNLVAVAALAVYIARLRRWRRDETSRARRHAAAAAAPTDEQAPEETRVLQPVDMLDYAPAEEHIRIMLPEPEPELALAVRRSG